VLEDNYESKYSLHTSNQADPLDTIQEQIFEDTSKSFLNSSPKLSFYPNQLQVLKKDKAPKYAVDYYGNRELCQELLEEGDDSSEQSFSVRQYKQAQDGLRSLLYSLDI
jgi:hypothetical protein